MKRSNFLNTLALLALAAVLPARVFSINLIKSTSNNIDEALIALRILIKDLRTEGSYIVRKTLNGKRYKRNESVHYPYEDSVEDTQTHCQVFFHAHRKNEYGHFHTFIDNEKGELVHLIMITMDKQGNPTSLSTLNRWVTGDTFEDSNKLKQLLPKFSISASLFPDKRIIEFINHIFTAYQPQIFHLFEERDEYITNYVSQNANEPFEDRQVEVLSSFKIQQLTDGTLS